MTRRPARGSDGSLRSRTARSFCNVVAPCVVLVRAGGAALIVEGGYVSAPMLARTRFRNPGAGGEVLAQGLAGQDEVAAVVGLEARPSRSIASGVARSRIFHV